MAIKNIGSVIELNSNWAQLSLNDLNSFYLIGIKETKGESEGEIDPKDVKIINFETGIESGISGKYLTTGYLSLNFDEFTSNDKELNSITAMARYLNYPSTFYIKASSIVTYNNEKLTKGKVNISLNINALKLRS